MDRFKKVVKITLPVFLGYVPLGIAFGVLLNEAGYGFWWSFLMAASIYAGSMQFVMVALLGGNDSLVSCALLSFLLQSRHCFYGLSLIDRYRKFPLLKRLYMIFSLTDETYSLMTSIQGQDEAQDDDFVFLISILNHSYWVLGCVLGSLVGNLIPFDTTGFDFVMTALFITIVIDQYRNTANHVPFWIGLGCGLLCLVLLGPDRFLLAALAASVVMLIIKERGVHHA
ncbi:MAG: AzlC family ABC transporter permease [Erysipelotrichaceae bacterium]|nr:AzlC family ABC transporter permease [Erysipelotrichaceae bacterium]